MVAIELTHQLWKEFVNRNMADRVPTERSKLSSASSFHPHHSSGDEKTGDAGLVESIYQVFLRKSRNFESYLIFLLFDKN